MLSYQHIYHAGCLADVHKHAALALVLTKMVDKPKALSYIETHAGRGVYDITCVEAEKTGEAKSGIIKFLADNKLPLQHPYLKTIAASKAAHGKNFYPGSAYIAKNILGENDQIVLMEMHPKEYAALKNNMRGTNIHTHKRDGYAGALAISPPQPRRGIVFIDPSYEKKVEYEIMADYISKLNKKWPQAVILLWYPILNAGLHDSMCQKIKALSLPKFWQQEVSFNKTGRIGVMQGSGLICINTPFGIDSELEDISGWF
jgi:23S rRNA (adenine2030-N6)-methyltransferase